MLHDADDSSCSSDGDDFLVTRRSPRPAGRSASEPQGVKAPFDSLNGGIGIPKYKTFDLGDGDGPTRDPFLSVRDGVRDGGYDSNSSRHGSRAGSRSASPAPGEAGDFVVISKATKRTSATIFDWTMVEGTRSGDELSGAEDSIKDVEAFEKKKLYLLVAQSIAYPFNAKFQIENTPPRTKLNAERFGRIKRILRQALEDYSKLEQMHSTRLSKQEQEVVRKRGFLDSVRWILDVVFPRPEIQTICEEGGFSVKELETIFGVKVASELAKESQTEEVSSADITLWCVTFRKIIEQGSRGFLGGDMTPPHSRKSGSSGNAVTGPIKDQLYKLFQKILKIQATVHQVLYRECQLGDPEEQEAVVRRELQTRSKSLVNRFSTVNDGKFGSKKVEEIYREEQQKMLKHLNNNLDLLSLQGSAVSTVEKKKKKGDGGNVPVSKKDLQFTMKIKVTLHDLLEMQPAYKGKEVFCTFGVQDTSGKEKEFMTPQTEVQSTTVQLGVENEFWVCSPLPQINLELRCVPKGLFSGGKLARCTHTAIPSPIEMMTMVNLLQKDAKEGSSPVAKLKISSLMERPSSMKKCGYLYCVGDHMFKQRKRTFFTLIQLSQYKFLLCSYLPNGSHPKESLMLDQGITVEYASDDGQLLGEPDARYLFDLIFDESEMGCIHFGCRDEAERQSWIEWMVRGTGQSSQPQQLGTAEVMKNKTGSTELERYGLKKVVEEVTAINSLDPHQMFVRLFQATLKYRLEEDLFSRGLFSPSQMYVLDEFCARYGVRDPFRHLTCLKEWLDHLERGVSIWPIMIQSSFRFCQMHVGGMNPPDKAVIVTTEERTQFVDVCKRIEEVVTYQVQNFRTVFPFCCPKADLRTTLKLFDMVATINYSARHPSNPVPQIIINNMLEKAALNNYKYVYGKLNLSEHPDGAPLTMALTFELAKLCIDFMYELHDFYWEELYQTNAIQQHINAFWLFFLVDVKEAVAGDSNVILKLQLFHIVNRYFSSQSTLKLDEFKSQFLEEFSPVVTAYIETLETSLKQELSASLLQDKWLPVSPTCCGAMEKAMKSLLSFQRFLSELSWPDDSFSIHLNYKVARICADCFQMTAQVVESQYSDVVLSGRKTLSLSSTLPQHFFTMLNTLVYLIDQVKDVCATQRVQLTESDQNDSAELDSEGLGIGEYLTNILDSMMSATIDKLCTPMQSLLEGLNRFDPSDGFLASLKRMIPSKVPIEGYTAYLSRNLDLINDYIVDTVFQNFVVYWYDGQMQLLSGWLEKRPEFSLHPMQQSFVEEISKVLYETFVSYKGIPPRRLRTESYDVVQDRMRIEKSNVDLLQIGKT